MDATERRIGDNLQRVRESMAEAAQMAGRPPEAVRLIAVTKYVDVETTRALIRAGCEDLGESRPQQLWDKAVQVAEHPESHAVRWHLIGHLQRNKIAKTLPFVHLTHSIDSLRLYQALNEWAMSHATEVDGLLEVNISGDASKHGFMPQDVAPIVHRMAEFPQVKIRGLMGMSGRSSDRAEARQQFAQLRHLRDTLQHDLPDGVVLSELSMGMSGDYCEAIAEGATMVRVGSALFEGIDV